jgi:HEAT repeat protein
MKYACLILTLWLPHSVCEEISPNPAEEIDKWLAALKTGDLEQRRHAAERLGTLGPAGIDVVYPLGQALLDADAGVRMKAAFALTRICTELESKAIALIDVVKGDTPLAGLVGLDVLEDFGISLSPPPRELMALLTNHNPVVRRNVAAALGRIGTAAQEATPALLATLKDEDLSVRNSAARALGSVGYWRYEEIARGLGDPDTRVRRGCAHALSWIGSIAAQSTPALMNILQSDKAEVKVAALIAVGQMGAFGRSNTKLIIEHLKHFDEMVRQAAAEACGNLIIKHSVNPLLKLLNDESLLVRHAAARSLGKLGNSSPKIVATLLEQIRRDDSQIASSSVTALGRIHAGSKEVLAEFGKLSKSETSEVRKAVAFALGRIQGQATERVSLLQVLLKDSNRLVRIGAIRALGSLGILAREAAPQLYTVLTGEDALLSSEAGKALSGMGETAVPVFIQALKSGKATREAAIRLGDLGEKAARSLDALNESFETADDTEAQIQISLALWKISGATGKVATLQSHLKHKQASIRRSAADALAKVGIVADALQMLNLSLTDRDWRVRVAAANALYRSGVPTDAFQALLAGLKCAVPGARAYAANALGDLNNKKALPHLRVALLQDADAYVRLSAASALWSLAQSTESIPVLVHTLRSRNNQHRFLALYALSQMGPKAAVASNAVFALLGDNDESIRLAAADALTSLK